MHPSHMIDVSSEHRLLTLKVGMKQSLPARRHPSLSKLNEAKTHRTHERNVYASLKLNL